MQSYTGKFGYKLMMLFWVAIGSGSLGFMLFPVNHHLDANFQVLRGIFALIFGGMLLVCLTGLLEAFTVYRIGADGVTRRAWNGSRTMAWRNLERFEWNGRADGTIVLIDSLGKKLTIYFTFLGKKGADLRKQVEPYLEPVRERQLRSLVGRSFRPAGDAVKVAFVVLSLMVFGVVFMLATIPVPPDQKWIMYLMIGLLGGGGLFLLAMLGRNMSRTLTVTDGEIIQKDVVGECRIAFDQAESVMSREVKTKDSSFEQTVIEASGKKITFTSQMSEYALLRDYIQAHVGQKVREQGEIAAEKIEAKQQKQTRILVPIVALIYMLMMGGMALKMVHDSKARLSKHLILDTRGVTTTGTIQSREITGGKNSKYLVNYSFEVNGETITSASPVSWHDYTQAGYRKPITVLYAQEDPHNCRAAQSIGEVQARKDLRFGYVFMVMGIVIPAFLAVTPFLKRKKPTSAAS